MRSLLFVSLVALGCSGSLEEGTVENDAAPNDADTAVSEDAATSDAEDSSTLEDAPPPDAPPKCGVVACDEAKNHYAKIQEAYDRHGGEPKVGTPADNGGGIYVHPWGDGNVQDFDGGSLGKVILAASNKAGTKTGYAVHGKIREAWLALGGGPELGYPIEDQNPGPGGTVQRFEKGCIAPDGRGGYDAYSACDDPPDMAPVLESIGTKSATYAPSTDFGIAVEWLPTGKRWGRRADVPRTSASSAKWFWAMAALSKASVATVEPPALPTFKSSDNYTAGQLIDIAGGCDAVNDFTSKTLGIPITELSLCGWSFGKTRRATNCSNRLGGDNFFTPNGALTFLEKSWKRAAIGVAKGDKLLEWAKLSPRSGYGGWIGTQLPGTARSGMHQKAGWLPTGCCSAGYPPHYNEIGIVHTARGPYAVVLSMKGGTDSRMIKTMEWASCVIFHALAKDVADPFAACTTP